MYFYVVSYCSPVKKTENTAERVHYRLCGLVVRVLDYRSRGPGFDSRALQKKSSGSGTESTQPREYN
jgi:hypothetical protein